MDQTRSPGLVVAMLAALAVGGICALSLPAMTATYRSGDMVIHSRFSWNLIKAAVRQDGQGWMIWAAYIGFGAACGSTVARTRAQRVRQAAEITGSLLLTLPLPIYVQSQATKAAAVYQGFGFGISAHIGSGLIIALLAFVAAAAIPWCALAIDPQSASGADSVPPRWMGQDSYHHEPTASKAYSNGQTPAAVPFGQRPATFGPVMMAFPSSGSPGAAIRVEAGGFPAGAALELKWRAASGISTVVATCHALPNGDAAAVFTVPENESSGPRALELTTSRGRKAVVEFDVLEAGESVGAEAAAPPA